jgi:bifunctional non-homologous end joining protein LigD
VATKKKPPRPARAPQTNQGARRNGKRRAWSAVAAALPGARPGANDDAPFAPELAQSVEEAPEGDHWLHEVKWDGYRLLTTIKDGHVRMWSRNAIEWTHKVPALIRMLQDLPVKNAHLDGEMIALVNGKSDFNVLKATLSNASAPLAYVVFDLVYLEGFNLRSVPLIDRKNLLQQLVPTRHPSILYSSHQVGRGPEIFAAAAEAQLEGIISKRTQSAYRPGRGGDWLKVKTTTSQEYAIVGYSEPTGSRESLGALLLAKPDGKGWSYVGRVGTGMSDAMLRQLLKQFQPLRQEKPSIPTANIPRPDLRGVTWIKPKYVAEVFYRGLGGKGLLRHASLKAVREDKMAADLWVDPDKPVKGRIKR